MTDKEKRREYHRNYHKAWYEKNREKRQQQIREYGKAHRADAVKRTQKYRDKNIEKVYRYGREYNQTVAGAYRIYKSGAAKKDREFTLSLEEFTSLVLRPCVYCGETEKRIGIDRIDNTLGYNRDNAAPCCKTCNMMKKNLPLNEFLSHTRKIAAFN